MSLMRHNPKAMKNLADAYYEGIGTEQNYEEAMKWYTKAAEWDVASSQYQLAHCYLEGKATEPDTIQALVWLRKAAKQGYKNAQEEVNMLEELTKPSLDSLANTAP